MVSYQQFLKQKMRRWTGSGFQCDDALLPSRRFSDYQRAIVRWACKKGRAGVFADTGLGKTVMQLAWAQQVHAYTGGRVLILAPLAVSWQTCGEAERYGMQAKVVQEQAECDAPICITNYEKLHRFDASSFQGIVLDESSILKSFQGRMKNKLIDAFQETPYRLACTATPSPNDHLELGNHSDFLGIMPQKEMLARWFVNDLMGNMSWRLKGHAKSDFWRWVSSWAVSLRKPSDLGFLDDGYSLPALKIEHVPVEATGITVDGALFADASLSATNLHNVMRQTAPFRAKRAAELLASEPDESWLLWTHTNYEADEMRALDLGLTEVRGSDSEAHKEKALLGFADGSVKRMISKPSICGFGMNWQQCARMMFVGMNYSYESFYQAVRRCWRFGQTRDVIVKVLATDHEFNLLDVIAKKQRDHRTMQDEMIALAKEEFAA